MADFGKKISAADKPFIDDAMKNLKSLDSSENVPKSFGQKVSGFFKKLFGCKTKKLTNEEQAMEALNKIVKPLMDDKDAFISVGSEIRAARVAKIDAKALREAQNEGMQMLLDGILSTRRSGKFSLLDAAKAAKSRGEEVGGELGKLLEETTNKG